MPVLENQRWELFAQEVSKGASADEAFVLAGFRKNRGNASTLRARPEVRARIDEILGAAAERAEITQAMVLEELAKIGFSDIRKMFTSGGNLVPIQDLDDDAAACLASVEVVTRKVPGGDENEVEHVSKIKVWDKRAALVDIGKHLGMFKERVEHTGADGEPLIPIMDDKEIARLLLFQLNKATAAD